MAYNPNNANGQATKANSAPVVLASDQDALPITDNGGSLTVDGTVTANAGTGTFAISAASLPLPTGAATAAKQPALGTAGTASADVLSVQGIASMTALKTDGSAVTQPVSISGNQAVNVAQVNGVAPTMGNGASGTGVQRVTLASDSTGQVALAAGTNGIGKLTANSGVTIGAVEIAAAQTLATVTNVATIGTSVTPGTGAANLGKAEDAVHASGDTGVYTLGTRQDTPTATAGTSGDYQSAAFTAQGAVWATLTPSTTGGWAVSSQTALTTTKIAVKAAAGTFGGYMVYNPNATVSYVQVFDVASASVTLGSTAPTYVIPVPATAGANVEFTNGINHATAITLAATTTATGLTAPGTALVAFFLYK